MSYSPSTKKEVRFTGGEFIYNPNFLKTSYPTTFKYPNGIEPMKLTKNPTTMFFKFCIL